MSQDNQQPQAEEFEPTVDYERQLEDGDWEPTEEYAKELEVSDVENNPPPFKAEGHPSVTVEEAELAEMISNGDFMGQESMGERKVITVQPPDEEREYFVMIDGKQLSPKDAAQALEDAFDLFGAYDLAVDEYKEGSKKKWAISQALKFKGVDMRRTVPLVRLSAARELYGYFVNKGQEDRFIFLKPAMTKEEKEALENPIFFSKNRGYE